jgi:DNA repair exonuclease SbcCD ATPase subunit
MGKFMKKKGYGARKRRDHNKEYVRRCYKCKSPDHVVVDSPYNSDNDKDEKKYKKEKKEKEEKKMTFTKKKKGSGYVVTWDSDGASDYDDGSSDDDKKSIKKALASITINNKPSIFDTPSTCLLAKPTKIKYDVSDDDDDCESGDCRSDDEKEYTKEELLDMSEQVYTCFEMKRKEYKELRKEIKSLEQSFDELNASHESLREDHEELSKAHSKLKKAHSSLLEQVKKEQVIVSRDVGQTCDILDESFYKSIADAPTNPSCNTSTYTSLLSYGFTCDASLMVENKTLKKEVNELTRALGNTYSRDARLLKCLGSQRFSLKKERLGYTPKKGKTAFVTPKASFVKDNGRFCNRYKQVRHIEQYCKTNKNKQPNVSSIRFNSCYMLVKGANDVKAKFIGT